MACSMFFFNMLIGRDYSLQTVRISIHTSVKLNIVARNTKQNKKTHKQNKTKKWYETTTKTNLMNSLFSQFSFSGSQRNVGTIYGSQITWICMVPVCHRLVYLCYGPGKYNIWVMNIFFQFPQGWRQTSWLKNLSQGYVHNKNWPFFGV